HVFQFQRARGYPRPCLRSSNLEVDVRNVNPRASHKAAANWSRPGQFFSLFLNSTCAVWGSFPGWGSLAFVRLEGCGRDAVVALGRGCAHAMTAGRVRPE